MRVIVDTSIWSLVLRRHSPVQNPETEILRKMIENGENIFLVGVILQEILQGVKERHDFIRLKERLDAFPMLEIEREHYVKAAELKNHLINNGVQISTVDALIATSAIVNGCYLYTNDKDFSHIAKHSKLRLLKIS
ncbi:MAG: PIN domain-containing protein [Thermodesulfovibrionales bacterium]|nr:PIN domain-containing protein [Thermodesulfovibrionales bacterium]